METIQSQSPLDRALALVEAALEDLESGRTPLSATIRKCIRIARLRNDYRNLWWLQVEMLSAAEMGDNYAQEHAAHFSKSEYLDLKKSHVERYIRERTGNPGTQPSGSPGRMRAKGLQETAVLAMSVEEIEEHIAQLNSAIVSAIPPAGLSPAAVYEVDSQCAAVRATLSQVLLERKQILFRIKQRVHDFLSATERQLIYGQLNASVFEQNRQYVDVKLRELSPEALDKLTTAYRRLAEDDAEARAQALTTCRRVLKSVADALYPPQSEPVVGSDGKSRDLSDDKYIARLWQFVSDRLGKSTSSRLLHSTITDLGSRIDHIYELSCKGVHAEVSAFEVNQCIMQTYLLVGDLMRLADSDSGADATEDDSP